MNFIEISNFKADFLKRSFKNRFSLFIESREVKHVPRYVTEQNTANVYFKWLNNFEEQAAGVQLILPNSYQSLPTPVQSMEQLLRIILSHKQLIQCQMETNN